MSTQSATSDALTIERRDGVMILHLDDGKANALSFELIAAISAAIDEAEADDTVGAVVVHGRPGRFSGGFDLGVMFGDDFPAIIRLVADGGALVHRLYGAGVPVVAACTGHALAAGALVLLGCDIRIGADVDAKIGLNEVAIKMVLPDWAFTIAGDRLSKRHIQRAVANARITTPRDAVDVGFLDAVVPADDVLDHAVAAAVELATTLDASAYQRTVRKLRGDVLDLMAEQVAADRAEGNSPI
jgi:enoyl-CoA hydratase